MKFVIFADKSYNYVKPLATGLHKTLLNMGHESVIWYDGLYWLQKLNLVKVFFADIYRLFLNLKCGNRKKYIYRFFNLLFFYNKRRREILNKCDCIILVQNCPLAFMPIKRLNYLREKYKKPIVNYDFHYLPNQGWWSRIKKIEGHRGLEQFDWYLPVGLTTEFAIPREIPQIYNCIGMDVNFKNLYPEQGEFCVLLDFARPGHEVQRCREKQMLDEIGIKYIELNGRYTTDEIRAIYRKSSVYIVSCRESFGLPIVELQLCGAKVLVPHKEWVPAHYLEKSINEARVGDLGKNFIVYQNDEDFKKILLKEKEEINYSINIENFRKEYPLYDHIDRTELQNFICRLKNGAITYNTHLLFSEYNQYMSLSDDYEKSDIK